MDRKRIKKQCTILLITLFIVCVFGIVGIVAVRTLQVTEEVLIVRYEDTKSIQEAARLGVDFLEVGELIIVSLGDDRYRVGVLVENPNRDWVAQSFEYNVIVDTVPQRHIATGVSSVGMAQNVLLTADVLVNDFSLSDVAFVIQQVDWEQKAYSRAMVRVRNPVFEYRDRNGTFVVEVSGILVNDSSSFIQKGSLGAIGIDKRGDTVLAGEIQFYSLHPYGEQRFVFQYDVFEDVAVYDMYFIISSVEN